MKQTIKSILHRGGLLSPVQKVYFNARTASPSVLRREIKYRRNSPDGYPLPPGRLIYDVIACHWASVYYDSGKLLVDDMSRILHRNELALDGFDRILDFGCGCGRLLRHVQSRTDAALEGTDLNPSVVEWSRSHLPFGSFGVNGINPPLKYSADRFDFVYARSVFTHLPEELQLAWIDELRRILSSGGYLYLTMHGRPLVDGLSDRRKHAFDAGKLVTTYRSIAGENLCSAFAPRSYVENALLDGFDMVDFVEGRDSEHLRQDIYLTRIPR